jgi:hypothetical protein
VSTVLKMLVAVAVVLGLCLANFLLEAIAHGFGSSLLGLICLVTLLGVAVSVLIRFIGDSA